jgi:predicted metalloprotease with PDZ domain
MKNSAILLWVFLFHAYVSSGQDTISYTVSFANAIHHEATISIELKNTTARSVKAIMSKSSPGRYAIHNFGKNIYLVNAFDGDGSRLSVQRIEPDVWMVPEVNGDLKITYTLYANHADGTYSGIDSDFALLNMPSSLMWLDEMTENPIKITFNVPNTNTWKIATQLILLDSAKNTYFAPNMQYLMDSPCMLGKIRMKKLETGSEDMPLIQMAFLAEDDDKELDHLKNLTEKVVAEQVAIFGGFPQFEGDSYTFLCGYAPGFYGDGMEHRNSSVVTESSVLAGNQISFTGSISHEFFHIWNVERIRPAALEPFNFTGHNMCGELWFAEGFTSYYGELTLCRAGIVDEGRYIGYLGSLINHCFNSPAPGYGSPVSMSEMATFTDPPVFIDETNFSNTYLSYYRYGEMIALALDLSLRTQFKNKSLDDLMKAMWLKYGVVEKPYTNADIEKTLAEVCGNNDFARSFFEKHIYHNELPDFERLFDQFGFKLLRKNPERPSLGIIQLRFEGDTAFVLSTPLAGSGLYDAGVNRGDKILSIDGQPVTSYPELNFIIGTRKIGDELIIEYAHHGKLKRGAFKVKEDNQLILIPKERFSIKVKDEEVALKTNWLKTRQ